MLRFFSVDPPSNSKWGKENGFLKLLSIALINIVLGSLAVFALVGAACLAFRTVFPM
jgi:hypothetical protein